MAAPGQITFETGNCPPGMYRPGVMYGCRPITSGQTYLQEDLARVAAHYVDDSPAIAQANTPIATSPQAILPLGPPAASAPMGIDTNLLLIGGLILAGIFFFKK